MSCGHCRLQREFVKAEPHDVILSSNGELELIRIRDGSVVDDITRQHHYSSWRLYKLVVWRLLIVLPSVPVLCHKLAGLIYDFLNRFSNSKRVAALSILGFPALAATSSLALQGQSYSCPEYVGDFDFTFAADTPSRCSTCSSFCTFCKVRLLSGRAHGVYPVTITYSHQKIGNARYTHHTIVLHEAYLVDDSQSVLFKALNKGVRNFCVWEHLCHEKLGTQ
eukprot:9130-Heterococcus_DN1.PRE.1